MTKNTILFLFLLLLLCNYLTARTNYTINEAWHFSQGSNPKNCGSGNNHNNCQIVSLPHTWNNKDAVDETPGYYRGICWYNRSIFIGEEARNKRITIDFEAANQVTELFVNEKFAGKHIGGYTRFSFDITPFVEVGKENKLRIKVDNSHNADIPPLSADFTFFGGIHGDVSLSFTSPIHVSTDDFASSGVYIYTPRVSKQQATVEAKILVKNDLPHNRRISVRHIILSPQGTIVSDAVSNVQLQGLERKEILMKPFSIEKPLLWSPTLPLLYTLQTILIDTETKDTLDIVHENFGLRWFKFDADQGFFLNGEPLKLIGTSRHQCFDRLGNALPDELHIQDILLLKQMGGNFLRIAHYPQDPYVLSLCDKLGIVTVIEIPIVNAITESEAFLQNSLYMAEEMVKQNFNHPSLVSWAYMNEVMLQPPFKNDPQRHAIYCGEVHKQAVAIENLIRGLDADRYTMIPFHGGIEAYKEAKLIEVPRIVGWNLYQGWYGGSLGGFDSFLDFFHKEYPAIPIIITEYGADVDPRLHSFSPERFDFTAEYANLYHEHYLKAIMSRPFVAGASIWNLNDFFSETRANAVPHINNKGITGLSRELKDTYLLYQAHLLKTPFVAIGSQNWYHRAGVENAENVCIQPIKIYSNLQRVQIFHNGKNLGAYAVSNGVVNMNVPFVHGDNLIKAVALKDGKEIEAFYQASFSLIPMDLRNPSTDFTELNVLLGSKRYFEAKTSHICWIPEQPYSKGSWGYVGGEPFLLRTRFGILPASDIDILNTEEDPVFQTQRIGIESFKADVPDGEYAVYLYWAHLIPAKKKDELIYNLGNTAIYEGEDNYLFNVSINRKMYLKNFDIPNQIGAERAIVKKVYVSVHNNEGISVDFESVGKSFLNAIRIVKLN